MIWLLLLLPPLLAVDQWMSRYTQPMPIYRSLPLWVGVASGVVLGVWLRVRG